MAIDKLSLTNFRNISDVTITLHPKLNFVYGLNASGKTSLLESLYFVSTGRSFKSRRIENIICRDTELTEFILFGILSKVKPNPGPPESESLSLLQIISVSKDCHLFVSPVCSHDSCVCLCPAGSHKKRRCCENKAQCYGGSGGVFLVLALLALGIWLGGILFLFKQNIIKISYRHMMLVIRRFTFL